MTGMCPHCGDEVKVRDGLTAYHDYPKPLRVVCPGSKQIPRCAESDARPLWNGEPNRRFAGGSNRTENGTEHELALAVVRAAKAYVDSEGYTTYEDLREALDAFDNRTENGVSIDPSEGKVISLALGHIEPDGSLVEDYREP